MKKFLIAASLVLIPIQSFAADLPLKARPVPTAVYNWTGWYVGGNLGGGWGRNDMVSTTPNDFVTATSFFDTAGPGPAPPMRLNPQGIVGGVQVGYNWQLQRNWLVGIEADFDGSGVKGSSNAFVGPQFFTGTYSFDTHLNWFGTVRGRVGFLPSSNLLIYGTGGFAYGSVSHSGNFTTTEPGFGSAGISLAGVGTTFACGADAAGGLGAVNPCFAGSSTKVLTGWTAGSGFEWAFTPNWSLKGEYLFISLQKTAITEAALGQCIPCGGVGFAPSTFDANFGRSTFQIARVGLNYHFGGPVVAKY